MSAWAIKVKFMSGGVDVEFFPGMYCWDERISTAAITPLFATRREAREYRKRMAFYKKEARVVRVLVTIDALDPEEESGEALRTNGKR